MYPHRTRHQNHPSRHAHLQLSSGSPRTTSSPLSGGTSATDTHLHEQTKPKHASNVHALRPLSITAHPSPCFNTRRPSSSPSSTAPTWRLVTRSSAKMDPQAPILLCNLRKTNGSDYCIRRRSSHLLPRPSRERSGLRKPITPPLEEAPALGTPREINLANATEKSLKKASSFTAYSSTTLRKPARTEQNSRRLTYASRNRRLPGTTVLQIIKNIKI